MKSEWFIPLSLVNNIKTRSYELSFKEYGNKGSVHQIYEQDFGNELRYGNEKQHQIIKSKMPPLY